MMLLMGDMRPWLVDLRAPPSPEETRREILRLWNEALSGLMEQAFPTRRIAMAEPVIVPGEGEVLFPYVLLRYPWPPPADYPYVYSSRGSA